MRRWMPLLFAVLGACTTHSSGSNTYVARFQAYPAEMMAAVKEVCSEPAQIYRRLSRDLAECREFLAPDLTAAAILQYDGTTKKLPQLVLRFSTWQDGQAHLFKTEAYLNVPQKTGGEVHVVFPSPGLDRQIAAAYRSVGGIPVTIAP